jgi:hypothetical protein
MPHVYVIQSRKGRGWAIIIALVIIGILIAGFVLLSGRSRVPSDTDELYNLSGKIKDQAF